MSDKANGASNSSSEGDYAAYFIPFSLTHCEEMTDLTVNYRRHFSHLHPCGLVSSDITLLHSSTPVFRRVQHQHILNPVLACKATKVGEP